MTTKTEVLDALRGIEHPEVKQNLVDLGMIGNVQIQNSTLSVEILLPYKNAPVKLDLENSVRRAIQTLDNNCSIQIGFGLMSQKARAAFMTAVDGGPKPAQSTNRISNTIAVLSGKGGVGKSSMTALLAVALRRQGAKVGVLDADITGPSIPKMFGVTKRPEASPVGILPVESETGIKVMSINLLLPGDDQAVVWRGPLIGSAIKQFWQDVSWGELDYLVVDLPPGTSDASLTVMQSIPLTGLILVTSPQDLAGMVARKAARMAKQMGAPILGMVENMSCITCPECGARIEVFGPSHAANTTSELGIAMLGQLPLNPEMALRCDAGEIERFHDQAFQPIYERVIERIEQI